MLTFAPPPSSAGTRPGEYGNCSLRLILQPIPKPAVNDLPLAAVEELEAKAKGI
jgi:hypothetical protein